MKRTSLKNNTFRHRQPALSWVYFIVLLAFGSLYSCGSNVSDDSIEGKVKLLEEKLKQYKALEAEISELKSDIARLKPEVVKEPKEITTDTLRPATFERFVSLQATVQPDHIVNIGSDVGGRITRLLVKEGQKINKGQLIATTDMEGMEKQMEELQVSLELANDVYQRQSRLWEQKIGSEIQFLQAKNNKERLEKSIAAMKANYAKRNIYSPISGVVQQEMLKEGEVASPGMPIIRAFSDRKLKVVADIPESYLGKVKQGDLVEIEIPALGKNFKRKVNLLGSAIDPTNRTFKIEIGIDNNDNTLKPNLLAIVKIQDLSIANALAMPLDLILEEVNGQKYVFVVERKNDNGEVAKKRNVTTGEVSGNLTIIKDGIQAGEEYINLGARNISDGDPVKRK